MPFSSTAGGYGSFRELPGLLGRGLIFQGTLLLVTETKGLGLPSPFFPGILLCRKPSKTQGKQMVCFGKERWLKRMEKESTPRQGKPLIFLWADQKKN